MGTTATGIPPLHNIGTTATGTYSECRVRFYCEQIDFKLYTEALVCTINMCTGIEPAYKYTYNIYLAGIVVVYVDVFITIRYSTH